MAERTLIIGAGITGLCAAHAALERGDEVLLCEAGALPGGVIGSDADDGYVVEKGPSTLLLRGHELKDWLTAKSGVHLIPVQKSTGKKRFVFRGGKIRPVPGGPLSLLACRLMGPGDLLSLFAEPFRGKPSPYPEDESVADFARRRLGQGWLDYLIGPFISGVYAGDPEKLSLRWAVGKIRNLERKHGSLVVGALLGGGGGGPKGAIHSCRGGLQELVDGLADKLGSALRLNTPVTSLKREEGLYHAGLKDGDAWRGERVILACGAQTTADLVAPLAPEADAFREIPQVGLASVSFAFREHDFEFVPRGFGVLFPRREPIRTLGTLFMSSLFPGRAPESKVLLSSFLGGSTDPEAAHLSEDELKTIVLNDLRKAGLIYKHVEPVKSWVHPWPDAMPQAQLGYGKFVDLRHTIEDKMPGLRLAGNAFTGVGLPKCVESGRAAGSGLPLVMDGEQP